MNKYLMLMSAAATALAGPGGTAPADAKTYGISLGSGCEFAIVGAGGVFASQNKAGAVTSTGQGLERKTSAGKFVELSDNYHGNYSSFAVSYDFSYPFKTGGTWAAWVEFSGTTSFVADSGTYTRCTGAASRGGRHVDVTRALIERLRAERTQH
jgi:hypothetical protein